MVDQGKKGYCAAATSERVLRYYGQDIDQHQIAQLANTTASGGTSHEEMRMALQAIARQYKLRFKTVYDLEIRDIEKDVRDYNRLAKRKGKRQLGELRGMISISGVYGAMDNEVFSEARAKQPGFKKFESTIQKAIDSGIPLQWSLLMGIVPEKGLPQSSGGHMRLIIGYNKKTGEIIYSDSWGAGHERKTMKIDKAWSITTGLYVLHPQGVSL